MLNRPMHVMTVICRDGWMSGNLTQGWRDLGCRVTEFFHGTHMGKSWTADGLAVNHDTNRRLLDTAARLSREEGLDLIFCVIYDDVLEVETIRQLRTLGVPVVNYHVDLVGQWYRILRTGQYFDRVACAHEDHWDALKRAGIRPFYMPMAANAVTETVATAPSHVFDGVVYLGSPWPFRQAVLGRLAREGVPMQIHGNNWLRKPADASNTHHWKKNAHDVVHYALPRLREEGVGGLTGSARMRLRRQAARPVDLPAIPAEAIRGRYDQADFGSIVRGAAINIGFTHFRGTPGTADEQRQVRLREFEIPMAGGFYLTQDCAQLRGLYRLGEHLDAWSDPDDLVEKVRYYLARPADRATIAERGRAHALRNHTWVQRFRSLLDDLSITPPARADAPVALLAQ